MDSSTAIAPISGNSIGGRAQLFFHGTTPLGTTFLCPIGKRNVVPSFETIPNILQEL